MIFNTQSAIDKLNEIFPQSKGGSAQISDIRLALKDVLIAAMDDSNTISKEDFIKFELIAPSTAPVPISSKFASYYTGRQINRPLMTRRFISTAFNKEFTLVCNLYGSISVFMGESFVGNLGNYSAIDEMHSIYGATCFDISPDETKIAIGCMHSDTIEVYNLNITEQGLALGNKIGRVGIWRSAGNTDTNRIQDPNSVLWLPNGNLLVSSNSGYSHNLTPTKSKYPGHVSEWDPVTGVCIHTHLGGFTSGKPWDNEIRSPFKMRIYDNSLYVSSADDVIGKWNILLNPDNSILLEYQTTYTKPSNIDIGNIEPKGFCISGDILWVASYTLYSVIGLDINTHEVVAKFGRWDWDDKAGAAENVNGFNGIVDIEPTGTPDKFLVVDYGNNRVNYSYADEYTLVNYNLPENIEVVHSDPEVDSDGNFYTVKGKDIPDLKLVYRKI